MTYRETITFRAGPLDGRHATIVRFRTGSRVQPHDCMIDGQLHRYKPSARAHEFAYVGTVDAKNAWWPDGEFECPTFAQDEDSGDE